MIKTNLYKNILIWGRHHALTKFQGDYIGSLIHSREGIDDTGSRIHLEEDSNLIFAINSSNHEFTKRNPLPLWIRSAQIEAFSRYIGVESYVAPVEDRGILPGNEFAKYTIESIVNQELAPVREINPDNTIVLGSTALVGNQFKSLGYRILPAEFNPETGAFNEPLPFNLVRDVNEYPSLDSKFFIENAHPVIRQIWGKYDLGNKIHELLSDLVIGEDAEFTETLNLWPYLDAMDQNMKFKWEDVREHILSGRVGDIGCAAGSLIKLLSNEEKHKQSVFLGVDGSRSMIKACKQRLERDEFSIPNIFFSRKNAYEVQVYSSNSMDVIHTGSMTHEILSRGGLEGLKKFLAFQYNSLVSGGVLVNRDVIGPDDGDRPILVKLESEDGRSYDFRKIYEDKEALGKYLEGVSTSAMFARFIEDFSPRFGNHIGSNFEIVTEEISGVKYHVMPLRVAVEFGFQNSYRGNWLSESEETLASISPSLWENLAKEAGFLIDPSSRYEINPWIRDNQFAGRIDLYSSTEDGLASLDLPPTHMVSVLRKP